MKQKKSDFMVWLGDDVYYFKKDYSSYDGMFNLNLRLRKNFRKYRDFLASQGCLAYQGYFFSRPLPLAGFEEYAQQV